MRVLFAPDYRSGNPYQTLLADALDARGVKVDFLSDYYRGLPLFRGARAKKPDIIHIHWPEQYFQKRSDFWGRLRVARYPLDCWLTQRYRPIVLTAHNLLPHNRAEERGVFRNIRITAQRAAAIFVHSSAARRCLCETFRLCEHRVRTIPFGDHAAKLGSPVPPEAARKRLGLPADAKVCLVFGTVSPYKGSDEIVNFWVENRLPWRLAIVGPVLSEDFADRLRKLARGHPMVDLRVHGSWLDDEMLKMWLSAADCAIFNYRKIFTSGAAALARSYGLPVLIPRRLISVDLDEPHPLVFRFDSFNTDFLSQLRAALETSSDYEMAAEWRKETSWERVAEITARTYDDVLRGHLAAQTPGI
jgi:glycosyltransferase involved in cell wall biosynthesis